MREKDVEVLADLGAIRLKLLIEFDTFARYSNVSRAANELGISQSTLSKHIFELEDKLGLYLVNRGPRLTLTLAGRIFAENVSGILGSLQDVVSSCRELQDENEQVLLVEEVSQVCAPRERLYKALAQYFADRPYARYEMVQPRGPNTKEALEKGVIDLCLWYDFGDTEKTIAKRAKEGLHLVHLAEDTLVAWFACDHPLARCESVRADMLLDYRVMDMVSQDSRRYSGFGRKYLNHLAGGETSQRFDSRIVHSFSEFLMLNPGSSVYILPRSFMGDQLVCMRENMVFRDLDPDSSRHSLFLAYREDSDSAVLRDFLAHLPRYL